MSKAVFSQARDKHEQWFEQFMASLMNHQGQIDNDLAIDHHLCDFGVWLHEEGLQRYGSLPAMQELARVHRELHQHVRNIYGRQQLHIKSRLEYQQLELSKERLMTLLHDLEAQVED